MNVQKRKEVLPPRVAEIELMITYYKKYRLHCTNLLVILRIKNCFIKVSAKWGAGGIL